MSVSQSGNRVHDVAVAVAESTRQTAIKGATQLAVKTAEITFYQTCLASAIANGINPKQYSEALKELGTNGV